MKTTVWVGRCLMAALLVVVGVQHFLYRQFVSTLVPAWIPWRLFWAEFVGAAFFAAAIALTLNVVARLAGILLGFLFLIFVVTTHVPRIAIRYGNGKTEAFQMTDPAAAETPREIEQASSGTIRVVIYYTDEHGQKVAHYFKKAS